MEGTGCSHCTGALDGIGREGGSGIKSQDTCKEAREDHFAAALEIPNIKSLPRPSLCECVCPEPTLSWLLG